jgi:hypothetical protein
LSACGTAPFPSGVPAGASGVAAASDADHSTGSIGESHSPASSAAADGTDSGLTQADVLNNHVDNAQRCDHIARQLNALIDWEMAQSQP